MQFITTGNRIMTENFSVGLFYTITFLNGNILACSCNGIGENFVSFLCTEPIMQFILDISTAETIDTIELYGGGAGTMNYNELENKPSINGEPLVGNLTTTDLHIRAVPAIDTTDNNKVLTASYNGGVTSYSWQTVETGTTNYNDLTNKPEINGHVLSGNQLPSQLGLATSSQGALADTAVQPATLASYQPLIDSSHKLDPALIATDTNNRFATDTQLNQIETNKTNISSVCDYGGKNIFEPTITSGTYYGLTVTVNADNTITINNSTALEESKYIVLGTATPKQAGTYTFDGTPSGITTETGGYMRIEQGSSGVSQVLTPVDIDLNNTQAFNVYLRVLAGKTYDNVTLKPLLCLKSLYQASSTYEPYAPSNRELYEMIKALQ